MPGKIINIGSIQSARSEAGSLMMSPGLRSFSPRTFALM
jgi:hypothetical protein